MVGHTYNPTPQELKAKALQFTTNLGYTERTCLNTLFKKDQ